MTNAERTEYYLEESFNLVEEFKEHLIKDRNLSKLTASSYGTDLKSFFNWHDRPYNEVKKDTVTDYIRHLVDKGRGGKTRNRHLSAIKTFYRYLMIDRELVPLNPADGVRIAKVESRLPKPVSEFDVDLLLSTVDNPRDYLIFELMYGLGVRRDELRKISRADVNFRAREVRVIGKGDSERIIPLYADALNLIKEQFERTGSTWLFPSIKAKGQPLSNRTINVIVTKWVEAAGLSDRNITPHKFRHAFGSHLYQNGADIKAISDMMGHRSVNTTQGYAQVSSTRNQQEYAMAHPRARKKQPN
ncbi:tyrosine-type recombinase/integrase [Paenibacillus xylanexedens]|uniref:tyrosine-type recombinase/integrase n=1 Tax=Paenibacillus xylanexedens TaxID=528191 RepID=UPI0011A628A7|nr:tyrosine-type recombinase/integrase [Paenibacillus xylanexedens]